MLNWFLQIVFALKYIHERGVLHRDLKTSNLFLSSSGVVKVGDFGVSRVLHGTLERAQTVIGTPYYMSPEVCQNELYSFKSDIWSLGCILYELCTLSYTFKSKNLMGLVNMIVHEPHEPIPSSYSKNLNDLVNQLLMKDPANRPSCDDLLQTTFMQKVLHKFLHPDSINELEQHPDTIYKETEIEETPMQRMKRKKEEAARKREEEIRLALKNNSNEFRMSHSKLRKKEQLQSVFDKNRQEYNDYPTMTVESIQLDGGFNPALSYKDTFQNSIKENHSKPSHTQYQNTHLKSTNKSFVTIQSQYVEDLPVRQNYVKQPSTVKEEEEFASDFEELEENLIDEAKIDDNYSLSKEPPTSKTQKFRNKLAEQIGPKLFERLYSSMKHLKDSGANEKTIKQSMKSQFGNSSLVHVFEIEQLFFMENN